MRFSEEELALAKSVDLCDVATALGYTVKRIGRYHTLKEMDSIRIYNRSHWFRWSRQYEAGNNGGSQIDFLRVFAGMEVKEAVFWLLDFAGYQKGMDIPKVEMPKEKPKEIKEFVLPEANDNNDKIISYLVNQRGLSKDTVDYFISQGLLYESKQYHNIVFFGNDKEGVTRFASMRGIYDKGGKSFKCDVAGNDKNYGFCVALSSSDVVNVFEAPIDLMSYVELYQAHGENSVALGGVADHPLETFLSDYPHIRTIRFCLDSDAAGVIAANELAKKYMEKGYEIKVVVPSNGCKDFNEMLIQRKSLCKGNGKMR